MNYGNFYELYCFNYFVGCFLEMGYIKFVRVCYIDSGVLLVNRRWIFFIRDIWLLIYLKELLWIK